MGFLLDILLVGLFVGFLFIGGKAIFGIGAEVMFASQKSGLGDE